MKNLTFQSIPNDSWEENMENKVIYVLVVVVQWMSLLKHLQVSKKSPFSFSFKVPDDCELFTPSPVYYFFSGLHVRVRQ